MFLYMIRHGEPDYATDSLTERGMRQAEAVGHRLASAGINRIFSSPLGRARQTAEPLCRLTGLPLGIEEWAREIEVEDRVPDGKGGTVGLSLIQNTEYRMGGAISLGYDSAFDAPRFCDSGMRDATHRITRSGDEFLSRLGYEATDGVYRILTPSEDRVALFCHGVMGRIWIASLLHIPMHLMWAGFRYTHTGVTVLEFKNNADGFTAPACLVYSDMSHLSSSPYTDTLYNGTKLI